MITEDHYKNAKEALVYDSGTGVFRWRKRKGQMKAGTIAGSLNLGYRQIKVSNKLMRAHRIAWYIIYSEMPPKYIDHINRQRDDNKIINLRAVTFSQNQINSNLRKDNKCGLIGLCQNKRKRWITFIMVQKKKRYLGCFVCPGIALSVRKKAEYKYYGEYIPT